MDSGPAPSGASRNDGRKWVVTVPFGPQGARWEVAHAALFPISNESSYATMHPQFLNGGHPGGIVRG